jgi:MFS family permease
MIERDRSYRALFAVPLLGRLLFGMQIARIAQSMVGVVLVLFTLHAYRSATLAGWATFCGIFPGLMVSPIAGALLDRHGRRRLVVLDYAVALGTLVLLAVLALTDALPPWLLLSIASISSLTAPLSSTGLRSLFPIIVPSHLWERVNAIDSMGYVSAAIIGPPLAAAIVASWSGETAFIVIGLTFGIAAIVLSRAPDPVITNGANKPLLREAWDGLVYAWRNPTLRGLGFSISFINLLNGTFTIVVPLIVLNRLHLGDTFVGLVFGVQGLTGLISALAFGRMDSRNRERMMLVLPMLGCGVFAAVLLLNTSLPVLALVMAANGFLNGPLDIALFTLRQRRTDPAWTGRAFAVSMSFNYVGIPVGAAIAGIVAGRSLELATAFGVVASIISAIIVVVMIPADARSNDSQISL